MTGLLFTATVLAFWSVFAGAAFALCDRWDVLVSYGYGGRDGAPAALGAMFGAPFLLLAILTIGLLRPDLRRRARERRLQRELDRLENTE